jgi:hypothetical protein
LYAASSAPDPVPPVDRDLLAVDEQGHPGN